MIEFMNGTETRWRALHWTTMAISVTLGLTLAWCVPSSLAAQSSCDDVSGDYDVRVDLPGGGPADIRLEIEQEDCEVTGIVGLMTRSQIQNGVVDGSTASFTFQASNQGDGSALEIRWVITIDGDEVTGTFSHDLFGSIAVVGARAGEPTAGL